MTLGTARVIKASDLVREKVTPGTFTGTFTFTGSDLARIVPRVVIEARAEADRIIAGAEGRAAAAVEVASAEAREREVAKLAAHALAMREQDEKRAERDLDRTIEVATLLAERLIGEALAVDATRIAHLAASALEQTRGAKKIRIEAHPDDVEPLGVMLLSTNHVVEITPDESLSRGSLVVHTELGRVDGRLRPQLARLAEVLRK